MVAVVQHLSAAGGRSQRPQDHVRHPVGVAKDVIIPEPEDAPSVAGEPCGPALIRRVVRVLTAIGLDRNAMFDARKIEDERPNGTLSSELIASQSAVA